MAEASEIQAPVSPILRCLAWAVDVPIILGFAWSAWLVTVRMADVPAGWTVALPGAIYVAVVVLYGMVLELSTGGQTVGKRALGLRVVACDGGRAGFVPILVRNVLRVIDLLPGAYLVGGVAALISSRSQRLGDLVAGTVVVSIPTAGEPEKFEPPPLRYNSFRDNAELAAALRASVSPEELALALDALARRDSLDANARVELFAALAAHFKEKTDMPVAVLAGLSDEQCIRNIFDVVTHDPPPPIPEDAQ